MRLRRRELLAAGAVLAVPGWATAAGTAKFPFRLTRNTLWTAVKIEDKDPVAFRLDSASSSYSIASGTAEKLGLRKLTESPAGGGGGRGGRGAPAADTGASADAAEPGAPAGFQRTTYQAKELLVGGAVRDQLVRLPTSFLPLPENLQGTAPVLDFGVMGFDFDTQEATMHAEFDGDRDGYQKVEMLPKATRPVIRAEVDGVPVRLRLDLGSPEALTLNGDFVKDNGLWDKAKPGEAGADGKERSRLLRVGRLKVGKMVFAGPLASISSPDSGGAIVNRDNTYTDGTIGMELLRRMNFVVDQPKRTFWAKPSKLATDGYRYDRSGASILRVGSEIKVMSVTTGGPAEKAGLKKDDKITGWKGQDGYDGLLWALRGAPGSKVEIEVQRDGKAELVAVTLAEPV